MAFIRKIKKGKNTYLAEVKNVWQNGKVVQKHVRYIGKEVDGEQVLSGNIERAEIDKVSIYGPLMIIDSVAKELELSELLGDNGDYILSLAYAHSIDPGSVKKLTQWFERTDIHTLLNIPNVTYKKLLESLEDVEGEYGWYIQSKLFKRLQERLNIIPEGYFYDITNAYFYGVKCPIAKKKKKPKSKNQPQIQVGLAVTKEDGIPIFHKVFEGNIYDGKTLSEILLMFREHQINDATIIWDRGVTSKDNIKEAIDVGFHVVCGLALKGDIKKIATPAVKKEAFSTIKNRVRLKSTTYYVEKKTYKYKGISGYLYICFNEKEKQRIKEARYDEIEKAIMQKKNGKTVKGGILKYIHGLVPKKTSIEEAECTDGVSALFSTKNLTAHEATKAYFEKDRVEKAFRILKGIMEMDKVRFWLEGKVKAHIFICYLSYLLYSIIDYKLKKRDINAGKALEIMSSMYRVYITDPKTKNKFTKTVILTKLQESILKAINPKLLNS